MLNLDLEKATFTRNNDGTYTVLQPLGRRGAMKFPRVAVTIQAEALDDTAGENWQYIKFPSPKGRKKTFHLKVKDLLRGKKNQTTGGIGLKKCTMCGKTFDMWDEQENFCFYHTVGYGSKYDMSRIEISFCCDCFDRIMDIIIPMCKKSPIIHKK